MAEIFSFVFWHMILPRAPLRAAPCYGGSRMRKTFKEPGTWNPELAICAWVSLWFRGPVL
jgi:hypothetical protein